MQVENDPLFKISKLEQQDGTISATIDINKDCEIFKGHFPGQPVVPGACMLQIVMDVLEKALGSAFRLKKADHLKFIVMIEPGNTQTVVLDIAYKFIEEDDINVTAKLVNNDMICFKFKGRFGKR